MTDNRERAFIEAVTSEFRFLEQEFGLRRAVRDDRDRYERFVVVAYAGRAVEFEIGIQIPWYDIWAAVIDPASTRTEGGVWALERLASPEQQDKRSPPRRWSEHLPDDDLSEAEIRAATQWYATLLRRHAVRVLGGDFTFLEAIESGVRG